MRHIRIKEYGAGATQGAFAPMRRIRMGVIGGGARKFREERGHHDDRR